MSSSKYAVSTSLTLKIRLSVWCPSTGAPLIAAYKVLSGGSRGRPGHHVAHGPARWDTPPFGSNRPRLARDLT